MVLDNNDEVWYDEAEEIDEAVELEGLEFPLRIGKNLQGMRPHLQALWLVFFTCVRRVNCVQCASPNQAASFLDEAVPSLEPRGLAGNQL